MEALIVILVILAIVALGIWVWNHRGTIGR